MPEEILVELGKIVRKHGDLPMKNELQDLGYGAIAGQIEKQGGYPYFREKLGLTLKYRRHGYWSQENTLAEARKLYEKYGNIPSETELRNLGLGSFPGAASEHFGGIVKLRKLLDEENAPQQRTQLENLLERYAG